MENNVLSVREIQARDIDLIIRYWLESDAAFLQGMGVDLNKMPGRDMWAEMLSAQLCQPYEMKQSYCLIWEKDGQAVGHSNINKIEFGDSAFMHLHLWIPGVRGQGLGVNFVKMTLPYFFGNMKLQKLFCEPYALNPAPNKALEKAGFRLVEQYVTTPGWLNFEQPVNRWEMSLEKFREL